MDGDCCVDHDRNLDIHEVKKVSENSSDSRTGISGKNGVKTATGATDANVKKKSSGSFVISRITSVDNNCSPVGIKKVIPAEGQKAFRVGAVSQQKEESSSSVHEYAEAGGMEKIPEENRSSDLFSDENTYRFLTPELDCPHCSALIVYALRDIPYIAKADYSLLTRIISITIDREAFLSSTIWENHNEKSDEPEMLSDSADIAIRLTSLVSDIVHKYEPEVSVVSINLNQKTNIHEDEENASEKTFLPGLSTISWLGISSAVFVAGLILYYAGSSGFIHYLAVFLLMLAYVLTGAEIIVKAVKRVKGNLFSEEFLMSIASGGAIIIGEYPEAVAVMLFYRIGEYFQNRAVNSSRRSIRALLDICPETANMSVGDSFVKVPASAVNPGDVIVVRPGERIPCDGIIRDGSGNLDMSGITGESVPVFRTVESEVYSGSVVLDGVIRVAVNRKADESVAARIIRMVEESGERKSHTENFITTFARYYTPVVVILALLLSTVPPFVFGESFSEWLKRALIFLVVSCPCALVISIPLSYFGGIGQLARHGVMFKGSNFLDAFSRVSTMFLDKTGTLTTGKFSLKRITSAVPADDRGLFVKAASLEQYSSHPLAVSLMEAAARDSIHLLPVKDIRESAGRGLSGNVAGSEIIVGNYQMMLDCAVKGLPENVQEEKSGTCVYIAENRIFAGCLYFADTIKNDSADAVRGLNELGIRTVMLTGDSCHIAGEVATAVGITEYHADLFPKDKLAELEREIAGNRERNSRGRTAFVGDGINDAPALALADVGIAMGGIGSGAAIESADVVIMNDEPAKLVLSMKIARKTMNIVRQNIFFAIGVKMLILLLGAWGVVGMWFAVFSDVGVMVLAVLNAMRLMAGGGKENGNAGE